MDYLVDVPKELSSKLSRKQQRGGYADRQGDSCAGLRAVYRTQRLCIENLQRLYACSAEVDQAIPRVFQVPQSER